MAKQIWPLPVEWPPINCGHRQKVTLPRDGGLLGSRSVRACSGHCDTLGWIAGNSMPQYKRASHIVCQLKWQMVSLNLNYCEAIAELFDHFAGAAVSTPQQLWEMNPISLVALRLYVFDTGEKSIHKCNKWKRAIKWEGDCNRCATYWECPAPILN